MLIRICSTLVLCCVMTATWAPAQDSSASKSGQPTANERTVFELTNRERKNAKLPALKLNMLLCKVARQHSQNMARQGKMEHILDGKKPSDRGRAAGYKFMRIGENIAMGEPEVPLPDLMKAWMDSKGHRANILHTEYTEIGIGIAADKDGQLFYTQLFARPK